MTWIWFMAGLFIGIFLGQITALLDCAKRRAGPLDKIVIHWCDLCGGSGEYEGEKCTLCPKVYEFDEKLNKRGLSPLIDRLLGKG